MPSEEKPTSPVATTFKPKGTTHPVQTGESWTSIASKHGLDPWELIDLNFPGMKQAKLANFPRACRNVNWYLREYVGCKVPSPDGNNWSFSSGLKEGKGVWKGGVIFVPAKKPVGPPVAPVVLPKLVASATDGIIVATNAAPNDPDLPVATPSYGQDLAFGVGRAAPAGQSVGTTEADLKTKMEKLLDRFAANDSTGMARRLFTQFLAKQAKVIYFSDKSLNTVAAGHENIKFFIKASLGAPPPIGISPTAGRIRIHQALQAAGWDIAKLVAPTDLGTSPLNLKSDFLNGLKVMINGIQYGYVIATKYKHDAAAAKYDISLKYIFYDVFGLDDDDLREFGAQSDSWTSTAHAIGFTAWWQLQHQFGYAPLITRIVVEQAFTVPAK